MLRIVLTKPPKNVGKLFTRSTCCFQGCKNYVKKLVITSGANPMSQTLAFLLKQAQCIKDVTLYDHSKNVRGIALDLNHINSKCKIRGHCERHSVRCAFQGAEIVVITDGWDCPLKRTDDECLEINGPIIYDYAAKISNLCPEALVCIVSPPINCLVPLFSEALKKLNSYDPNKIFGVCTLVEMRSNSIVADFLHLDPVSVRIPMVGGVSFYTSVPLFSNAKPFSDFSEDDVHNLTTAVLEIPQEGRKLHTAAPLSLAYATARFILTLVAGICGSSSSVQTAYIYSNAIPQVKYFASHVHFGPQGACLNYGLPKMNNYELRMLENSAAVLERDIEKGIFLFEDLQMKACKKETEKCQNKPVLLKTPIQPCPPCPHTPRPTDICPEKIHDQICSSRS